MLPMSFIRCSLLVYLLAGSILLTYGKGGRGGGGSRGGGRSSGGGWGRSSSSSSSSSSKSSSSSGISFSSSRRSFPSANYPRQPIRHQPLVPSGTSLSQGIPNANYPRQQFSRDPVISFQSSLPKVDISNANYPRQTFHSNPVKPFQNSYPQLGIPNSNYPRQPISSDTFIHSQSLPSQGGIPIANYPRQSISSNPFLPSQSLPSQGGILNANYPRQSISSNPFIPSQSSSSQRGLPTANFPGQYSFGSSQLPGVQIANLPKQAITPNLVKPWSHTSPLRQPTIQIQPSKTSSGFGIRSPSGIPNANYPRQAVLPPQTLGSGVWNPKSGTSAPVYMNYGGLPTGANMYTRPMKQKGFLGSLISMGSSKSKPYQNKHYHSYPSPYGIGGGMPSDVLGGFMGNRGSKTAMYTILPYMAARKSSKVFKPKFRFYNYRPIHYHSHGYHSHLHDTEYANVRYDVYNNEYVGRCNRPIKPDHAKIVCNSTHNQVDCDVTCEVGYRHPDNGTSKTNKCWHATGVWNPTKNFPGCKPVCKEACLNGGKCASPGVCQCSSEYRGPHCEHHFTKCNIQKLAKGMKIRWMCTHTKNETFCRVKCKSPAQFATASESLYKCTPDGVWTPNSIPLCVLPDSEARTEVTAL